MKANNTKQVKMVVQNPLKTIKDQIKTQRDSFGIILVVIILILIIGIGAYYLGIKTNQPKQNTAPSNITTQTSPTEVIKESNEHLIVGDCNTSTLCTLKQVPIIGTQSEYQNKYNFNKDTQTLFSQDGNYVIYLSESGLTIIDLKANSTKNITASKQAKLIRIHKDSFWVEDSGIYKLITFNGDTKVSFAKSLFPRHYPTLEISVDFSNLYPNSKVLALSYTGAGGSIVRTAWEISPDEQPKKLFEFHFNKTGSPHINSVKFFNTEPAFLVTSETETYKLTSANQKTVLIEGGNNPGVNETPVNPMLSPDDSEIYYSLVGLYKYDLRSNTKQELIRGGYNPSDQSTHYYQVLSVSPSGKYLSLTDAAVSTQKSTIYTPSIFSLEDSSIKRLSNDSADIYKARKVFGWIISAE